MNQTLSVDLQRVNYTRNVAQNRKHYVDEEICIAPSLQEDTQRWQENGDYDLDNVAVRIPSVMAEKAYRRAHHGELYALVAVACAFRRTDLAVNGILASYST